jgi:hypothetical protein
MRKCYFFTALLLSFINISSLAFAQELFTLRGKIVDSKTKSPLPSVVVRVLNSTKGTLSDDNGNFQISLSKAAYEIQFSIVGYNTETKNIDFTKNDNIIIELKESFVQLSEVLVVAEDPGIGIIRRAIANKKKWMDRLHSYKCNAYSKQIINKEDSIASIAEAFSYGYWRKPEGFRERVFQKRQTENIKMAQNFAMVGGIVNFNEDVIAVAGFKFTGPTSPDALDDYTFKLLKTYESRGFNIYEIQIIPVSRYKPLFEGTICISDSVYSITKVDVKPNDVFKLPFIKNFSLSFGQRFDVYDTSFWMPVDIAINAKFEISIPGISMPAFGFKQRSILYDYEINKSIPDSIFSKKKIVIDTLTKKIDSVYWEKNRVLPLSSHEEKIYKTLDSTQTLDKQFKPSGALMAFEKTDRSSLLGALNYTDFHFNRVQGYFLGGQFDERVNKSFSLSGSVGYGFSDKKWKYSAGLGYKVPLFDYSNLSFTFFNKVQNRPGQGFFTDGMITLACILAKDDYGDYYSAKGFDFVYSFYPLDHISLNIKYLDEDENSLSNKAGHGFISNKKIRQNLPIIDGKMRNLSFGLNIYDIFKQEEGAFVKVTIGEEKPTISVDIETSGDELKSNFNYTKYNFSFSHDFPTFLRSLFLKPYLSFTIRGGFSTGKLPPQRLFDLESAYDGYAPFGTFRSMSLKEYSGDSYFEAHLEHNFRTLPSRLVHFNWLEEQGVEFLLFGSFGKTWLADDTKNYLNSSFYKTPDNWYSEMGFGLSKILLFLRTDFTWRVSNRKKDNFFVTFRIGNIL